MRAWLSQKGVEPDARDFFADPFSEDELRQLIGGRSPADIFSWRSPSFKKLGVGRHSLDDEQLVSLMLEEPRLIRRPLVVVEGELIDGRDQEALSMALAIE